MVVVGGGWVVLSLQSPLLHGCCGRWLGCIKSSVTSAVWLLWDGCCIKSLVTSAVWRWLGCIKSSVTSAVMVVVGGGWVV